MLVPEDALSELKCSICNNYLSYFPIYVYHESSICGRCIPNIILTDSHIRNKSYEILAQYLKFPCIYHSEGCIENLTPNDVANHEQCCFYRIISCSLDCIWQGPLNEFVQHIEELHPAAILQNGEFEINILESYETFSFLIHNDEIFSLKRVFNRVKNILKCSLFCYRSIDTISQYFYEICVYNGTRSLKIEFPSKSAMNFKDENVTMIEIDKIKKSLDDPVMIIGCIRVIDFEEEEKKFKPKETNPEINIEMLRELECPVCLDYIIPPIYQCVTGHSICSNCKTQISNCPICKEEIKNTQNFVLEKMAFLLTYPCKFSDHGCDFASKAINIKQHEKFCKFSTQFCPLKDYEVCNWKNTTTEIYNHVYRNHHDNILEIDILSKFLEDDYFENTDSECYIKKCANQLFKVHYQYSEKCFSWAVQLIGPPDEAAQYHFEIDILDCSNNNQKIFLRSLCAPVTEKNEAFSDENRFVFLELDQIKPMLTSQLNYTLRIVK